MSRKYRDRAFGLMGAFAILITGVVATGAVEPGAERAEPMQATEAALGSAKTEKADDCASAIQSRPDTFC